MSTPIPKAKITADHQMLAMACANRFGLDELQVKDATRTIRVVAQMFAEYESAVRADMFVDAAQSFSGAIGPETKAVEQFLLTL